MPISFSSNLSSTVANQTFLDKTVDDLKKGVLGLYKVLPSDPDAISDIQDYTNEIAGVSGIAGEGDATAKTYSSEDIVANGDDRKVAIGKLDAQVKINLDNIALNASEIQAIEDDYGANDGLATLDSGGKVPLTQLPNDLLIYKGTWDASTNTPTLDDTDTGVDNFWYRCNVAGTVDFGTGNITFAIGDKVVSNGTVWSKWDTTDEVNSVFGRAGDVIAQTGDYTPTQVGLGNVTNDAQLKRAAGDINTFTEKVTPVANDILLMEDSADSFNKKKVKLTDLLGGGASLPSVTTKSSSVTLLTTETLVLANASGGAITLTLPSAVGNEGLTYFIKKTNDSSFHVTVEGDGVETIGGELNRVMYGIDDELEFFSNNVEWIIKHKRNTIYARATGNDSEAITVSTEDLPFKTISEDTAGAWTNAGNTGSNTNDSFTCPAGEAGEYILVVAVRANAVSSAEVHAYVDGSFRAFLGLFAARVNTMASGIIRLEAGEVLTIRVDIGITLQGGTTDHHISIRKLY